MKRWHSFISGPPGASELAPKPQGPPCCFQRRIALYPIGPSNQANRPFDWMGHHELVVPRRLVLDACGSSRPGPWPPRLHLLFFIGLFGCTAVAQILRVSNVTQSLLRHQVCLQDGAEHRITASQRHTY